MIENGFMNNKSPRIPLEKGKQTDRQKRLSAALRENLRKRKAQTQEREKIVDNILSDPPSE